MLRTFVLLFHLAGGARAADVPGGSWLLGAGGGYALLYGGAKNQVSRPILVGGSVLFAPTEDHSWAFEVDRLFFRKKRDNQLDATLLTFVARGLLVNKNREVVPYALLGVGWSELQADLGPAGRDRGAGAALSLGAGFFKVKDSPLSWGTEARLIRLGAGSPKLGLGGVTLFALTVRATFRLGPFSDPFRR